VTQDDEIRRGKKAQLVLDDEILSSAILKLEIDQLGFFKHSKPDETAKRENAWCMLQAIEALRQELIKIADNGKIAQKAAERAQQRLI
jgi:hypothetical protein